MVWSILESVSASRRLPGGEAGEEKRLGHVVNCQIEPIVAWSSGGKRINLL